jgi:hypothetical protein
VEGHWRVATSEVHGDEYLGIVQASISLQVLIDTLSILQAVKNW